jgi:hypothetical protein
MERIGPAVGDYRHIGRGTLHMRLDGQHIAKFWDRIDLETLGVADNDGVKPFALSKMDGR